MKLTFSFALLIGILCFSFFVSSCGGEDVPPPVMNKKAEPTGVIIGNQTIVNCPNAGTNCATPIPCSGSRQAYLDEFTRIYNHDSLGYYFTDGNWSELFSSLKYEPLMKDSLRRGLYSIVFDDAGNILIRNPNIIVNDAESYTNATRFAVRLAPCIY